jgi:dienelactone hydrolase
VAPCGRLTRKQNVFDDFVACAEHLVSGGYTTPDRLAIEGGSNGGLLMGAALTQRPDLFRAVVSHAGIYDMLRVELSPNGAFNIPEYGSVKDPDQFRALHGYSPYHRVADGRGYPAVLFLTGANDPRVDPMQSRKMTARLQAGGASPVLLRTSAASGHGFGTPLDEQIEVQVDVLSFLFDVRGWPPRGARAQGPAARPAARARPPRVRRLRALGRPGSAAVAASSASTSGGGGDGRGLGVGRRGHDLLDNLGAQLHVVLERGNDVAARGAALQRHPARNEEFLVGRGARRLAARGQDHSRVRVNHRGDDAVRLGPRPRAGPTRVEALHDAGPHGSGKAAARGLSHDRLRAVEADPDRPHHLRVVAHEPGVGPVVGRPRLSRGQSLEARLPYGLARPAQEGPRAASVRRYATRGSRTRRLDPDAQTTFLSGSSTCTISRGFTPVPRPANAV